MKLSLVDILIVFVTLASSHSFFVLRERLLAVLMLTILVVVFHFLKRYEMKRFIVLVTAFLISFWALQIKYPFVGYIFWPIDQFLGAFFVFIFAKILDYRREPVSWNLKFSKNMLLSMVGIIVPSLVCLILYFVTHKEIADQWPLPNMPLWAIPFAIILTATINGLREEIYFRFTLQKYLGTAHSAHLAVVCSSILFG